MNKQQVKNLIKSSIIEAMTESGRSSFNQSQVVVPVKTGNLKRSGNITESNDSVIIEYKAEYSSEVERGTKGGLVNVKAYRRKDGVFVRPHKMNQKPRQGRHYIENSLNLFFKDRLGMKTFFQQNVLNNLKKNFPGKKITSNY